MAAIMRIREFAARAGVTQHAVRYYVRVGQLRPRRTVIGYARFDASDIQRFAFVRLAPRLGFTVDGVGNRLAMYSCHGALERNLESLTYAQRTGLTLRCRWRDATLIDVVRGLVGQGLATDENHMNITHET